MIQESPFRLSQPGQHAGLHPRRHHHRRAGDRGEHRVFSLVNALLIRPLPFKAPQELVLLFEKFSAPGSRPDPGLGAGIS